MSSVRFRVQHLVVPAMLAATGVSLLADPPPPRRPDPISLDPASPSIGFGNTTSDIYGENPPFVLLGFGWDVGGPGPIPHVPGPNYGVFPPGNTDGVSNGEFNANMLQFFYFSGTDTSTGLAATPYRAQFVRRQAAGDRWVINGRTSVAPAVTAAGGPAAAIVAPFVLGGPVHILSANQTRFNEIPSLPPPAFSPFPMPDDMDGLEITPIDLNGDLLHDRPVYFSVDLATGPGADVFVSPPGAAAFLVFAPAPTMGLTPADDIDGLAVWDRGAIFVPDPGLDVVMFSLRPGSPRLAGPDGVMGTADDFSAADIFVSNLTGGFRRYLTATQLGLRFQDDVDAIDVEPALNGATPEFMDRWVQRVNIDIFLPPWVPPPGANDLHVELIGIQPGQVRDPWTGSFPNATIGSVSGGTQINWSGANFPPGSMAHIGWEITDPTNLQFARIWWTINGAPISIVQIPDLVQTWDARGEGSPNGQQIVDVLVNRWTQPVQVMRRALISPRTLTLSDLLVGSDAWNQSVPIEIVPLTLMSQQPIELPFPYHINTLGYGVFYDVLAEQGHGIERIATYLTALTVEQSPDFQQPFGACCFSDGQCLELNPGICTGNGGQYLGDGSLCGVASCETHLLGDMNCDGVVNILDINPFTLAIANPAAYQVQYPSCDISNGDINQDGATDILDINGFIALLAGG